jgi:hypothetical protein
MGQVRVLHVPWSRQFADILTKGLPSPLFSGFSVQSQCPYSSHCDCGRVLEKCHIMIARDMSYYVT